MDNQSVNSRHMSAQSEPASLYITLDSGKQVPFSHEYVMELLYDAIMPYKDSIDVETIIKHVQRNVFNGITQAELVDNIILVTAQLIEVDSAYSYVGARLMHNKIFTEVLGYAPTAQNYTESYKHAFVDGIHAGIEAGFFDKRLLDFNLHALAEHLNPERDHLMRYLGVRTLYNRYLKKINKRKIELVQNFWMRVAMGLAIESDQKEQDAIAFYDVLSQLYYVSSTPTLLHSGLVRSQLSSCFLTYIADDLTNIFKCVGDNAQMSKWSGGVANSWTALRGTGALIKSISIGSQGTIPFLKIANDTTAAINRSGSRRGAVCAYMETWHIDYEDFLDLRRNTGDERRRTHDMNTASWIPDLFMKRVLEDKEWTLFSPDETPDLVETYGRQFEQLYAEYEQKAQQGKIKLYKTVSAKKLWRKMLTRLFETGHPWNTFKDACNVRSPQDHAGVIHSSNLCTEITLNTSETETAVCNLGSVNLGRMIVDGKLDRQLLAKTIKTAIKMLDNVIDINFYPTVEGANSNKKHRPIGLGMMGLQDALAKLGYAFDSDEALDFTDEVTEEVSYHAILSSSQLAKEKGSYESFKGSKWDRGIFPYDTIDLLAEQRGMDIEKIGKMRKDWSLVKAHVAQYGMRNSNTMAVAPTATISNIAGCFPCIEPIYKNLYVKSNSSGEFAVVNQYLEADLKKLGLWNQDIRDQIKFHDGSIQSIENIPADIRAKYKTAFELDPFRLVDMTAARGKWIDQSQSHNVFMQGVSGKKLHDIYMYGWKRGLKTFYYLRSLGATQIEKSTLGGQYASQYTQMRNSTASNTDAKQNISAQAVDDFGGVIKQQACNINDEECEACQ